VGGESEKYSGCANDMGGHCYPTYRSSPTSLQ
jgi:hypothetical protein